MECVICKNKIELQANGWSEGHNAEPIKIGRCCDECNYKVVLPARIEQMFI